MRCGPTVAGAVPCSALPRSVPLRSAPARLAALLLGCLVLAGCGSSRASPRAARSSPATTAAATTPAHRTAGASPPRGASPATRAAPAAPASRSSHGTSHVSGRGPAGGWRTPAQAVRAFAATYIDWTAATVAARLRALAAVSVGQARATLLTQAREVAGDRELQRGGVENSGTVEAVAPLSGRADMYAVVTREQTGALRDAAYSGLQPEWHVSVATVTRTRTGLWILDAWQPES